MVKRRRAVTLPGRMSDPHLNIVVWGINYSPEQTGIAPFNRGLCRFLHAQGHHVSMVSAFSYYPAWRKAPGDEGRLYRTDIVDGIPVHRCWQHVPRRATTAGRLLHELSFGVTSFLRVLSRPRADLYIVVSPPLLLGPLAWVASRLKRSRYVFHVQDLQPDAALALGMMKEGIFARLLRWAARLSYHKAGLVSGISKSMMEVFEAYGVSPKRQYLFPNWVVLDPQQAAATVARLDPGPGHPRANGYRATTVDPGGADRETDGGVATLEAPVAVDPQLAWRRRHQIPADAFVASYSGNLGRKQGLDVLVDAALTLERQGGGERRPVCIVIAGDGAARPDLESRLKQRTPASLRLLPLLPNDDYLALLATSDVCLITQGKGTGRFCFPSKLLSTLLAARPVAAVADDTSELAHAVRDGGFGILVPPENPEAVAAALSDLADRPADLAAFSQKGLRWVTRFEYRAVLQQFEARLKELVPVV